MITSGYRCPKLNKQIKGSKTSQHCFGNAVDFYGSKISLKDLFNLIIDMDLNYDQLIWEFGSWIHLGISNNPRKQILKATRRRYGVVYTYINKIQ